MTVLHALRCLGGSGPTGVAEAAGMSGAATESALIDLAVAGLVTFDPGAFGGWRITAEGKAADDVAVAEELDTTGARNAVHDAYQRFLELNPELLDLCTAWQLRPGPVVLTRFADLHRRCDAVLEPLADPLPRFDRHRTGLRDALDRARAGDTAQLTDDLGSYHARWFRLHEDFLVTLGIPRH